MNAGCFVRRMSDDEQWWLTQLDAARTLGVTPDMLRSMIRVGQLHPIRVGGRRVLRRSEVEAIRDEWAEPTTIEA